VPGRVITILITGLLVLSGVALTLYYLERPGSDTPTAQGPRADTTAPSPTPEDAPPPAPAAPAPDRTVERIPPPAPVETVPTTGSLRIESDVPDTSVFVDREYLGTAPVTKTELVPGPHTVLLSPLDYESLSEVVDVEAGEERHVSISFMTIRLDAAIIVKHKHTFGSCEGTLQASPAGLVYDTSDEDDAFTLAFAELDTFEIDYLDTNLRVKIRDGKTYNFTDPDGDADPLFVFHRDVEKVRQRIAAGR
jgi:hypothetical protein